MTVGHRRQRPDWGARDRHELEWNAGSRRSPGTAMPRASSALRTRLRLTEALKITSTELAARVENHIAEYGAVKPRRK